MIAKGCGIADTGTVRNDSEVTQLVADLRKKRARSSGS